MITRLQPAEVVRAWRADVARPVDVLNLISVSDRFESYRWYGLLVAPLVYGLGGSVRWMGRHERSVLGEQQADKLMVVRYRSHRHFMAMTLNPYYLAINRLREQGVRHFEASWTHASLDGPLGSQRELLVAHYNSAPEADALDGVRAALEPACGPLVYASRESASLGFLSPPRPTDPTPLSFREVAFFAAGEDGSGNGASRPPLDGGLSDEVVVRLRQATSGVSLQLYRREHPRANLPSLGRG